MIKLWRIGLERPVESKGGKELIRDSGDKHQRRESI
jgi:hypothetical protein